MGILLETNVKGAVEAHKQVHIVLFYFFSLVGGLHQRHARTWKHVVCLLFAVESSSARQMDRGVGIGTDEPYDWMKARKEYRLVPVSSLDL